MANENCERVVGVGLFVVSPSLHPRSYLTVEEFTTKKSTFKIAGMRSFPMETIEPGETQAQALIRLLREELVISPEVSIIDLATIMLMQVEISTGIWVNDYLLDAPTESIFSIGSTRHEVGNISWTTFDQLNESFTTKYRYRPSNHEIIRAYQKYLSNPESFIPEKYRLYELFGYLPDEEFDRLTTSQKIAQSQPAFFSAQYPLIG